MIPDLPCAAHLAFETYAAGALPSHECCPVCRFLLISIDWESKP